MPFDSPATVLNISFVSWFYMYAGVSMCVCAFFCFVFFWFLFYFLGVLYCVCFCVQCFRVNMAMIRSPRWNKQKNVQNTHNLTFHNTTTTKNNSQQYGVPKQFPLVVKCIGISRECFVLIWYQWESDDNDDDDTNEDDDGAWKRFLVSVNEETITISFGLGDEMKKKP